MKGERLDRRFLLKSAVGAAVGTAALGHYRPARAATKIRFLTNFYAEHDQGGHYQAQATGLYSKAGLDVEIRQGNPQLNAMQLLLGGSVDIIMGKCATILSGVENGIPAVAIAASYQWELQGMMTHADVSSIADLKAHKIMMGSSGRVNYWPWLKKKYGFSDSQTIPYAVSMQPFFVDKNIAVAAIASAEPYVAQQANVPTKFFPFSSEGWPPYGAPLVTTQDFLRKNREALGAFVRASLEGWKSYVQNPAPGNTLIKADNPKMTDGQIAFATNVFKDLKIIEGGDAATMGIGVMTEQRWKNLRDVLVKSALLKESVDWKSAFTTELVQDLRIMM